nr:hypothetical protein [Acidobacteriota bacterium]
MSTYPWTRFWCTREGSVLQDWNGFLEDPLDEFGSLINPNAKTLPDLADIHFLGLLGEAGSGKTQTLSAEFASNQGLIRDAGHIPRYLSLHDIGSGEDLDRQIFETEWFQEWRQGESRLYLFLDALDEAKDSYSRIASRLVTRLSDLPIDRLFVRVTCRTASWPTTFDREVKSMFERESVVNPYAVYELLPLRRIDVENAARMEDLDPEAFVSEVIQRDLVPLAARPLTLRFLIDSRKENKSLPLSSLEAYDLGCRSLASEANLNRLDADAVGNLDVEHRLAVAERIAAVTLLCNRQAIQLDHERRDLGNDASLDDLRGVERVNGRNFDVSDREIREVLGTGLFSSRGEGRFGWSHRTFGEFLAARYLIRREFTIPQILSFVNTPDDASRSVRPQLAGTAAWLASMSRPIQLELSETNPEVLLLGDATKYQIDVRRRLTERVLERLRDAEFIDREWKFFRLYRKLNHPGIAELLRERIADRELDLHTRREAILIARTCGARGLSDVLADLALDRNGPLPLRVSAASCVASIGTAEAKVRLRPLAAGVPEDNDDELKAASLEALWPETMETPEVLTYLSRRRQPNHFGSYHRFLLSIPEDAKDGDIPLLLDWIAGLDQSYSLSRTFGHIASRVLSRAWGLAGNDQMARIARAVRRVHQLHLEVSGIDWTKDAEQRRSLVE